MTFRAVIIGAVLGLLLAVFGYANDWVLKLPYIAADLLPVGVFGLLMLGLLLVNPLMSLLRLRQFSGAEWAVMFALVLVCSVIPSPALMWQFSSAMMQPGISSETEAGWGPGGKNLLQYVPPSMVVDPQGPQWQTARDGWIQGLTPAGKMMPFSAVPWKAWAPVLGLYLPLIGLVFVGCICMSLIVHRQWAYREHLRYPIAQVVEELISAEGKSLFSPIFKNKLFWLGFAFSAFVLLLNGRSTYVTEGLTFPMGLDFTSLGWKWPRVQKYPEWEYAFEPRYSFAVIGLAFLLASEVSFTVGISNFAHIAFFVLLVEAGIDVTGDGTSGGLLNFQWFGAYLGCGILILYTGRKFYWGVAKRAFGRPSSEDVDRTAIWAARILLLSTAAFIIVLRVVLGLDLVLATLTSMLIGLTYLVISRLNTEVGVLFVQPNWQATGIILGLFGIHALGPTPLMIVGLLCVVMTLDPRVALMPFVSNALRVADSQKVQRGRLSRYMAGVLLLALVVGVVGTIYIQYTHGGRNLYGWGNSFVMGPFKTLSNNLDQLIGENALATAGQADGAGGLERLLHAHPSGKFLWGAGLGLGMFLLTSAARLRWHWWPIHPLLFLIWGTRFSEWYAASFLVGWILKVIVSNFGGGSGYRKGRAFFIGLIAGEMFAGVFWIIFGAGLYLVTGVVRTGFRVHR